PRAVVGGDRRVRLPERQHGGSLESGASDAGRAEVAGMTLAQPRFLTFTDVLTQPQARVLAAILHMADDAGPITVRSIGEACGLSSSSSVWFILKQLRALDL